jgi:ketosteroid isomerase-like protein
MTHDEIVAFNAAWLKAWSDKDVDALCAFYTEDCVYKDPQTVEGLNGQSALRAYLTGLFAALPTTLYTPEAVWPIAEGYCGRWYCAMGEHGSAGRLRGFDLVLMREGRIAFNEVYVHQMAA